MVPAKEGKVVWSIWNILKVIGDERGNQQIEGSKIKRGNPKIGDGDGWKGEGGLKHLEHISKVIGDKRGNLKIGDGDGAKKEGCLKYPGNKMGTG